MLPLLLAVITVAAARYLPLVYPFENEIESLSPLIRYSSGPLWVNPTIVSRNTSTSLPQRNVTQDDVPMDAPGLFPLDQSAFKPFLEKGWTALYAAEYDVRYPYYYVSTGAVGDSFTFSIPSSVEARVFGKSIDAQVSVDVDGVQHPDVQVSESTLDSYFEFPIKNIQRGPGLLNVTVTLRRGMITISRLRFQFPPSDYSTDWWERVGVQTLQDRQRMESGKLEKTKKLEEGEDDASLPA
ncbi:hypothetical protein CspeluHIS016_0104320 [Cutaneotrichosporon spelunceum]|uniref:Uncharacterized protein n=1 Tax=Cutaneotrichosporon spelunceum TaxID=1672016 RepID=A0AAD3TMW9_9TREE|nr:hypothetical protein CspeluHIS016_0104320 [Cutaneotrichosporon spelunceum]